MEAFLIAGSQPAEVELLGIALAGKSACKIEMNRHLHFNRNRGPIEQSWLILPLPDSVECRGHEQRIS